MIGCTVSRCDRKHESKGLCKSHAQRARAGKPIYCSCGEPIPLLKGMKLTTCLSCKSKKTCLVCPELVFQKEYCYIHYFRWWRNGTVIPLCLRCGSETGSDKAYAKYCEECRNTIRRESSLSNERQRRAIKLNIPYEKFSREEIYTLDNGICYLCRNPVDIAKMHLDHIIPLTREGSSGIMANVATTHEGCNQKKNNRHPEECAHIFPNQMLPERFVLWRQEQK